VLSIPPQSLQVRAKNINPDLLDNIVSRLANTPCPEQGNELLGLIAVGGVHRSAPWHRHRHGIGIFG
jgi:hypothetical protein